MDPKVDKKKKRSRSTSPKATSIASTPSVIRTKSPSVMETPPREQQVQEVTTSLLPPIAVTGTPFIAENRVYPLKDIVANADFRQGIIKARCTGFGLKEKVGKASGKPFWIAEILLTDSVTRVLSCIYNNFEAIPVQPNAGDLVAVTGVKPVVAVYDARLYGAVQLDASVGFKMTIIKVAPNDPRIPAHWSPVSVKVPQEPIMSVEDFMQGLC